MNPALTMLLRELFRNHIFQVIRLGCNPASLKHLGHWSVCDVRITAICCHIDACNGVHERLLELAVFAMRLTIGRICKSDFAVNVKKSVYRNILNILNANRVSTISKKFVHDNPRCGFKILLVATFACGDKRFFHRGNNFIRDELFVLAISLCDKFNHCFCSFQATASRLFRLAK